MTRETMGKMVLIMPSSVFFFILVPLASSFFGRRVDVLYGLPSLEPGRWGMILAPSLLIVWAY